MEVKNSIRKFRKTNIKKILIIYWGFFGDLIITTPLLEYLHKGFPLAKIVYIIGGFEPKRIPKSFNHGSALLKHNPYINRCIISKVSILKDLLTEKPYDLVIDLCGSKFSTLLSYISGAKLRIWGRFRELPEDFFYSWRLNNGTWTKPIKIKLNRRYCRAQRFLEIARTLGIKTKGQVILRLFLSRKEKVYCQSFFKKINKNNNLVVGMHPGGRLLHRLWSPKNYALLADRLIEELKAKVIVFYGPQEKKTAQQVLRYSNYKLIKVLKKDIRKYIALVSGCDLFITTDGGPLHIALAVEVNSIGMFSNKYNKHYWYNHYPRNLFFPVSIDTYNLKQNEIEVEKVFKKAKFILYKYSKNKCRPKKLS